MFKHAFYRATAMILMLGICLSCAACGQSNLSSDGIGSVLRFIPFLQSDDASTQATTDIAPTDTIPVITTPQYVPELGEDSAADSELMWIDYANASQGYIMAQYLGNHTGKIKFQITGPDDITYTYNLAVGEDFQTFPLTGGSGGYTFHTYEQDSGNSYYLVDSIATDVTIADPLTPYLYPNQYVSYTQDSSAVALSVEAATGACSELALVESIYTTVMDTVDYDYDLANLIATGGISSYIPVIDETIATGSGICFDYAVLMVALLRIQEKPAKLVIGYAGETYHAWINVYTAENGWVDEVIYFDGNTWVLMDPTFADTAGGSKNLVSDTISYTQKYVY